MPKKVKKSYLTSVALIRKNQENESFIDEHEGRVWHTKKTDAFTTVHSEFFSQTLILKIDF